MSFYGVVCRLQRIYIIVNGGPDDRVDVLLDVKDNGAESTTKLHYYTEDIYNSLLFDGGPPYNVIRLHFTEDNGSVVYASYVYHNEHGQVLHYVDGEYNHYSAMHTARLVLVCELARNDLPKAIEIYAVKTSRMGKDELEDDEICTICMEEYQEDDMIGRMVRCEHSYHDECIKKWLQRNRLCPICRASAFYIEFYAPCSG